MKTDPKFLILLEIRDSIKPETNCTPQFIRYEVNVSCLFSCRIKACLSWVSVIFRQKGPNILSQSVPLAAIIKYYRLGGLNNRNLFFTVLRSPNQGTGRFSFWRGFLPGLQTTFSCILTWHREESLVSLPLLTRALIPSWELHPHALS